MFLSSVRVRSSSEPSGRIDTLTSKRREPFSISASEIPSSTTVWRSSWRKRFAWSAEWRSGAVTISTSGVPARLKSTSVCSAPAMRPSAPPTWTFLAASSSRCARTIPTSMLAVRRRQREPSVDAERLVVLGDLVALRQVGIEVVLAVEDRVLDDAAAERVAEEDRHLDRAPVRHGQRPGVREADGARARVLGREVLELAAAEHLRLRLQVDVDLEADDRFPIHRSRSGT